MKAIIISILCFFLLTSTGIAQETINKEGIHLSSVSHNGEIRLRWMFSDYNLWRLANQHGYTLKRQLTGSSNSQVILNSSITPLDESSWGNLSLDSSLQDAVRAMLYDESLEYQSEGVPTFNDAVQSSQTEDNILFLAMLSAERDFELATAMGLGTLDGTVENGVNYLYILEVNHPDGAFITTSTFASVDDEPIYPQPENVNYEISDDHVILSWPLAPLDDSYSHYTIQRSTDQIDWVDCNEAPFISFSSDNNEDDPIAIYKDSLENNIGTYYYRLFGTSPFSIDGPVSEVIEVVGVPARIGLRMNIDSTLIQGNQTTIGWYNLSATWNTEIQGFNVYRSLSYDGPFEKMNGGLIGPLERSFKMTSDDVHSYYKVEALDKYDRVYPSYIKLVSIPDLIGPEKPKDFKGESAPLDKINVTWTPNEEEDLMGYRLFRSLMRYGVFEMVSEDALTKSIYQDNLENNMLSDSIFYKIEAYDLNSNSSGFTDIIGVARYDYVAPIAPLLYKAIPTPSGIELGWEFSGSLDVVSHEVRRRKAGFPDWEIVVNIEKYNEAQYIGLNDGSIAETKYIDTDLLDVQFTYEYHIVAYDEMGNSAGSTILSVLPYDTGIKKPVEDLSILSNCIVTSAAITLDSKTVDDANKIIDHYADHDSIPPGLKMLMASFLVEENIFGDSYTQQELEELSDGAFVSLLKIMLDRGGQNEDLLQCEIGLNWTYEISRGMYGFRIYRSMGGSTMIHYKTLGIESFFDGIEPDSGVQTFNFVDEEVLSDRRFIYKIMVEYIDGSLSDFSNASTTIASN